MADLQQLLFTGGRAPLQRGAITGQLSRNQPAPTSFSDPLYVVLPTWDINEYFTITDWPACHGSTLPSAGAEVLLVRDDQNILRCVWWDSAITGFTPNGTAGGDLTGTYPNPGVAKLQGHAVSTTAPVTGGGLAWNGTAWTPMAPLTKAYVLSNGSNAVFTTGAWSYVSSPYTWTVQNDVGGNWHTDHYVAPVTGTYLCEVTITTSVTNFYLGVGSDSTHLHIQQYHNSDTWLHCAKIIRLTAGESAYLLVDPQIAGLYIGVGGVEQEAIYNYIAVTQLGF